MADSRFNLNPVEGDDDGEFFAQIAKHNKEWSTPTPELTRVSSASAADRPINAEQIFDKHGRPKPWLPTKDRIAMGRLGTAKNISRFMQTAFAQKTLGSILRPECSTRDMEVKTPHGVVVPIRIYTPMTNQKAYPVMVCSHSGGFCTGDLNTEEFICRLLCRSHDLVVVDVDYRLCPEYSLYDARDDVYNVVEWVSRNSTKIGGDLNKGFLIAGVSAGGLHSLNALYRSRDRQLKPAVTGVLIICTGGVTEMTEGMKTKALFPGRMLSAVENEFAPFSDKATNVCYAELADAKIDDPEMSYFYRTDHSNLPPLYYQTAGMDYLRDGALVSLRTI